MLIQSCPEAERRARAFAGRWPQRLREVGALRLRKATPADRVDPEVEARQRLLVGVAVEEWSDGEVLLLEPRVDRFAHDQMRTLVNCLTVSGDTRAVAFSIYPSERDELCLLWDRAWLLHGGHPRALITWDRRRGELCVSGPFRSASARLIQPLVELPIVSAESLRLFLHAAGQDRADAPAYRWSNRIATLRRSGLLLPLDQLTEVTTAVRAAHAEAVGRPLDQRPTRLYRSVLYDLQRAYGSEVWSRRSAR